jgi:hypothetical protein
MAFSSFLRFSFGKFLWKVPLESSFGFPLDFPLDFPLENPLDFPLENPFVLFVILVILVWRSKFPFFSILSL